MKILKWKINIFGLTFIITVLNRQRVVFVVVVVVVVVVVGVLLLLLLLFMLLLFNLKFVLSIPQVHVTHPTDHVICDVTWHAVDETNNPDESSALMRATYLPEPITCTQTMLSTNHNPHIWRYHWSTLVKWCGEGPVRLPYWWRHIWRDVIS